MGSITIEVEFPCGYKYKFYAREFGIKAKMEGTLPLCPIHKNKCKKEVHQK